MSPSAQTRANRRNARHSTGPRTPQGKARAAGNSRTHGLSAALLSGDDHAIVEALIGALREDGPAGNPEPLARSLVDLTRVRQVQFAVLNDRLQHPVEQLLLLERMQRYESRARASIRRLIDVDDVLKAAHPERIQER